MANPFDIFKDILNEETLIPVPPDTSNVKPETSKEIIKTNPFSAFEDILKDREINAPTENDQHSDFVNTSADSLMQKALKEVVEGGDGMLEQETQEQLDYDDATLSTQIKEVDKVDLPEGLISSKPEEIDTTLDEKEDGSLKDDEFDKFFRARAKELGMTYDEYDDILSLQ